MVCLCVCVCIEALLQSRPLPHIPDLPDGDAPVGAPAGASAGAPAGGPATAPAPAASQPLDAANR